MKFYALLVTLVFLLIGVVLAEPETTSGKTIVAPVEISGDKPVVPAKPEDPVLMLQDITNNVLQALRSRGGSETSLKGVYNLVDKYIIPYADFDEMSQWVAGRKVWGKATEKTKESFMDAFKILLVRTYATALNSYTNEKVVFPQQKLDLTKQRIQIRSTIVRTNEKQENIRVDYRLLKKNSKWYVYDIIIEGVSILQGFQAQFSNEIKQKGLEKVTVQIQEHNRVNNA